MLNDNEPTSVTVDYTETPDPPFIPKLLVGFGVVYILGIIYAISSSVN